MLPRRARHSEGEKRSLASKLGSFFGRSPSEASSSIYDTPRSETGYAAPESGSRPTSPRVEYVSPILSSSAERIHAGPSSSPLGFNSLERTEVAAGAHTARAGRSQHRESPGARSRSAAPVLHAQGQGRGSWRGEDSTDSQGRLREQRFGSSVPVACFQEIENQLRQEEELTAYITKELESVKRAMEMIVASAQRKKQAHRMRVMKLSSDYKAKASRLDAEIAQLESVFSSLTGQVEHSRRMECGGCGDVFSLLRDDSGKMEFEGRAPQIQSARPVLQSLSSSASSSQHTGVQQSRTDEELLDRRRVYGSSYGSSHNSPHRSRPVTSRDTFTNPDRQRWDAYGSSQFNTGSTGTGSYS